jgi:hypothetical protein
VPLIETAREQDTQERAFLVGIDVRTRGRSKGVVTAQAQAARDAASSSTAGVKSGAAGKSNKPSIPEFDADESLAELHTLAGSAGAKIVGEILQRRDRPDPATLIGAGKLEEIAGAISKRSSSAASSTARSSFSIFLPGTRAPGKASCKSSWRNCITCFLGSPDVA